MKTSDAAALGLGITTAVVGLGLAIVCPLVGLGVGAYYAAGAATAAGMSTAAVWGMGALGAFGGLVVGRIAAPLVLLAGLGVAGALAGATKLVSMGLSKISKFFKDEETPAPHAIVMPALQGSSFRIDSVKSSFSTACEKANDNAKPAVVSAPKAKRWFSI